MHRNKPKAYQMARSILPSTARKMTRERKRKLHHRNRTEIREKLHNFHGKASDVVEEYDDYREDLNHCWTPRYMPEWDHIVYDRRGADKLNHFVHWAKRITDHLPQDEKMDFIRPMLPPGVIGTHARSHLYELEPHDPFRRYLYSPEELAEREAKAKARLAVKRDYNEAMHAALWAAADNNGARRKLNRALYHRTNPNAISYKLMREGNVFWYQRVKGNGIPVIQMKGRNGAGAIWELVQFRIRVKDEWLAKFLCEYFNINNPLA